MFLFNNGLFDMFCNVCVVVVGVEIVFFEIQMQGMNFCGLWEGINCGGWLCWQFKMCMLGFSMYFIDICMLVVLGGDCCQMFFYCWIMYVGRVMMCLNWGVLFCQSCCVIIVQCIVQQCQFMVFLQGEGKLVFYFCIKMCFYVQVDGVVQ